MRSRLAQLGVCPIKFSTELCLKSPFKPRPGFGRKMSNSTHEERTAAEQRENAIHHVSLDKISSVNESIRLLQLRIPANQRIKASIPELSNAVATC